MASTPTRLLTFAEYEQIPNPPGGRYELHHGELVNVAFPEFPHVKAQHQLRRLLESVSGSFGVVHTEMPYRPLPENECWGADIALISQARWESIERYLFGSPELVVEVLSPSNTATEMLDKEQTCFEGGAQEFWVVDTRRQTIRVTTASGHTVSYKPGQDIPLFFAAGAVLKVAEVFA